MAVEAIKVHTTPINFLSPVFDNKKLFPKTNERLSYLKTICPNTTVFRSSVEEINTAPQRIKQVLKKYEMEPASDISITIYYNENGQDFGCIFNMTNYWNMRTDEASYSSFFIDTPEEEKNELEVLDAMSVWAVILSTNRS